MNRRPAHAALPIAAAALLLLMLAAPPRLETRPAASVSGLKVVGNRLTDSAGRPLMLRGANRSGPEYACIQGWGIFDGPSDAASVQAMAAWGINYTRIPLNEDCWLGINGVDSAYGGASYRTAIASYVNHLNLYGIYVELSLIWGAPGTNQATYQPPAPDQDHSPAFWTSVATTFKSNASVFFGVWGEPTVSWIGLEEIEDLDGNLLVAGSQQLVTAIRNAGATQPIAVPGIDYANDLTHWLDYEPVDPLGALVAEAHIYGNNLCGAQNGGACLTTSIAPVSAVVPVIFGETGETFDDSECTSANMRVILPWADAHNVGYAAWTWDTWGDCLSLISSYNGTPNTTSPAGAAYAQYVHDHILSLNPRLPIAPGAGSSPGARSPIPQAPTGPPPRAR